MKKDPYRILGLSPGATDGEVKAAFRALAKTRHPDCDRTPGANARFHEIEQAYRSVATARARRAIATRIALEKVIADLRTAKAEEDARRVALEAAIARGDGPVAILVAPLFASKSPLERSLWSLAALVADQKLGLNFSRSAVQSNPTGSRR